jgi:hypothetical protein
VSPADVEEVIANAEERNGLEGDDGSQVRSKLRVWWSAGGKKNKLG